ncbi:MAG TPA: phosphate ABC transporter permease subunit PstC [Candidatus Limnocylindrales bacterium]|nr:phosphate ABC transporter permease subunit PstC [Candidatus Limnocylindrales bacterium]
MSAVATTPALDLTSGSRGRSTDPAFRWIVTGAGAMVLVILAWMIGSTTISSWAIFAKEGLGFFTSDVWRPGSSRTEITGEYGAAAFLYGTLLTSAIAIAMATPLAVGIALFLTQLAPKRIRGALTYTVDLLAMIPSVVIGLWAVSFFVPAVIFPVEQGLAGSVGGILPIFAGPPTVRSFFAAGVVLALMILPIITAIVREVFATTPPDERYAAFGLGATRWEVMRHVVLPGARPGIIGATMLGLGRALGETIAVLLVIGGSPQITAALFKPGQTIAGNIASQFGEASPEGITGLIALGVALFAITIVINMSARVIVWRLGEIKGDSAL